jgi:hypothetical protein
MNTSPACQHQGLANLRFPVDLYTYDTKAQRLVFDEFALATQRNPALNRSFFLFEGYSLQAVKAVPADSTAVPFRHNNLLVVPVVVYERQGPLLDAKAAEFGESLRQILFQTSGQKHLYAYVNYAFGNEGPRSWYGHEKWRLDRLEALKEKYDPGLRLNYYAPVL